MPGENVDAPTGRIPRLARLLALAIKFDSLVRAGAIRNHAGLGGVSRARISQIMNLLSLTPDIQEDILWFPRTKLASAEAPREKKDDFAMTRRRLFTRPSPFRVRLA